jgi:two-component system phosphate regulon response regulator PhoB
MAKILVVEDEVFVRDLYEKILKQAGFEAILADDAKAALDKLKEKPDLILLDILLPGIDGLQVLKKIKSDSSTKEIPVLMLTNMGEEEYVRRAVHLGASGYIIKMRIEPADLISHIKEFLGN